MKVSELIEFLSQVENPDETEACLMVRLEDDDEEQEVMPLNKVEVMENPETGEEMAVLVCDFDAEGGDEDEDEDEDDEDEESDDDDDEDEED